MDQIQKKLLNIIDWDKGALYCSLCFEYTLLKSKKSLTKQNSHCSQLGSHFCFTLKLKLREVNRGKN